MAAEPWSEETAYRNAGLGHVHEILASGCEIPPSLEVFKFTLKREREKRPSGFVDEAQVALALARNYHRLG